MSEDEDLIALMRGCAEFPHDLARRLILADYLEEHGKPVEAEWWRRCMFSSTRDEALTIYGFGDGDGYRYKYGAGYGDGSRYGDGYGYGDGVGYGNEDFNEIKWGKYTQHVSMPQGEIT